MRETPDKADFDKFADAINGAVRRAVAEEFDALESPLDEGEKVVATMAGIITAAGFWCGVFEPTINGDVMLSVLADQFNEGRKAARETEPQP